MDPVIHISGPCISGLLQLRLQQCCGVGKRHLPCACRGKKGKIPVFWLTLCNGLWFTFNIPQGMQHVVAFGSWRALLICLWMLDTSLSICKCDVECVLHYISSLKDAISITCFLWQEFSLLNEQNVVIIPEVIFSLCAGFSSPAINSADASQLIHDYNFSSKVYYQFSKGVISHLSNSKLFYLSLLY